MVRTASTSRSAASYREIVPNARLVFSWAWHTTPERESQVTVSLLSEGGGTLLTLHHEQFFDEAAREQPCPRMDRTAREARKIFCLKQGACHATAQDRLTRRMDQSPQSALGA